MTFCCQKHWRDRGEAFGVFGYPGASRSQNSRPSPKSHPLASAQAAIPAASASSSGKSTPNLSLAQATAAALRMALGVRVVIRVPSTTGCHVLASTVAVGNPRRSKACSQRPSSLAKYSPVAGLTLTNGSSMATRLGANVATSSAARSTSWYAATKHVPRRITRSPRRITIPVVSAESTPTMVKTTPVLARIRPNAGKSAPKV